MASAIISSVCNALSLTDFYKYVLNSIRCESHCCRDFCSCELETKEIELSNDEENDNVKLVETCCIGLHDIYTSGSEDELESETEELVINV